MSKALRPLILLDLDDTLINTTETRTNWLNTFADQHGLNAEQRSLMFRLEEQAAGDYEGLGKLIVEAGLLDIDPNAFGADLRHGIAAGVRIYDGVSERLDAIRNLVPLVIVTNGPTDQQVERIERSGLDQLVLGWVISQMARAAKPDPAPILMALRCYAGLSEQSLMIGDSDTDVVAANRAGVRSIWISGGRSWDRIGDPICAATIVRALESITLLSNSQLMIDSSLNQ